MIEEILSPEFVMISLPPMLVGLLACLACALPGNFLLLRRQALIGDAISHVALPGIVLAFLLTGTVAAWPMLLGAGAAALVAVALIEAVRRLGRIESGAAMGVVFTALFAAGVLLLERSDASSVHLDVQHALYGNLESLIWFDAMGWGSLLDPAALATLPEAAPRLAVVLVAIALLTRLFWKELALTTFDPAHASAIGLPTGLIGAGLAAATAVAAVAAFDAVGSIIVIAMFVCPPAAARLMTDRLGRQVAWSLVFAAISAIGGYVLAGYGPGWFGRPDAVSAAGMIAVVAGAILAAACLAGPRRRRAGATAA
ncbi:metal ABC transporter permease [Albimonas pacifica]|uniref:Manganese/zinc/iron transport system permease protein n=1 Tax=Albimonas pacifica TaxID=1114924 RepID=A0A1I3KA89_9RHOB|nr:metal ABC transporter permease [Albimonas pacifica]SFI69115.1 manganese/zinc/iron transport system permease protein [Albimonas pacifica]